MKNLPKLIFCDTDNDVIEALKYHFRSVSDVGFQVGNILDIASNIVLSPANSYGFMDGGIDKDYANFFGDNLQRNVLEKVRSRPEGYLPVGAAVRIQTGHKEIPFLILSPTMLHPEMIPSINVFRAFRAALKCIRSHKVEGPVYSPGFGTGVGGVEPDEAANMMFEAYSSVFL